MRSAPAGGVGFATGSGPTILLGVLVADRLAREGLIPHKDLWPLSARDAVGLVLAALSLLVAAGGGIGGCYCVCRKVQLHCRQFGARSLVPPTPNVCAALRNRLRRHASGCMANYPCTQAVQSTILHVLTQVVEHCLCLS